MTTQKLLSYFRRAIIQYNLISDGDKIAVGLSGGKDSLTLLTLFKAYQRFSTEKFDLTAINIDLGFDDTGQGQKALQEYCDKIDVKLDVVKTDIFQVVFKHRQESNPCSLCSKMRRGALCNRAERLKFNKVALGHHSDDLMETFFMSMFYEGRLSTFSPKSYLTKTGITIIRPMLLINECDIISYAKNLPVVFNPCPVNHHTSREYMKNLLKSIQKDIPIAKERIFKAIISPERYNLFNKFDTNTDAEV